MNVAACNICGNVAGNRRWQAREKMDGTLEAFDYVQCSVCGHLQLETPLADMGKYYARNYSPFHVRHIPPLRRWLYRLRTAPALGRPAPLGRLLNLLKKPYYCYWLEQTGLRRGDRFLDVGCGAGALVRILRCAGLESTGIDRYFPAAASGAAGDGVVQRRDLLDETGRYRAVLFDHSFEHVPNPRELLAKAAAILEPGGCVIVRIPLSDSFAMYRYGSNWVQWDAPRHLNLFTRDSFGRLAGQCGLRVETMLQDSSSFQFWASEDYCHDRFFHSPESFAQSQRYDHFTRRQMRDYARWAKWLNRMGAGDQATFICRRISEDPAGSGAKTPPRKTNP